MTPEELRGPVSDLLQEHGFDEVAKFLRGIADGPEGDLSAGHVVRVRPLEWSLSRDGDLYASTIFGSMQVQSDSLDPDQWEWRWHFSEYHDEGSEPCESMEDGREKAERFYFDRLSGGVESLMAAVPDTLPELQKGE